MRRERQGQNHRRLSLHTPPTGLSWLDPGESCVSMELIKSVLGWQAGGPSRSCTRGPSSTKPAVWGSGKETPPGSPSDGRNKLGAVPASSKEPTNVSAWWHVHQQSGCPPDDTYTGSQMSAHTAHRKCDTHPVLLVTWQKVSHTHMHTELTSVIMKKSSPGSPCTTIFSPSSNWTGSRASATVKRSHLSRDSVIGQCIRISESYVSFSAANKQSTKLFKDFQSSFFPQAVRALHSFFMTYPTQRGIKNNKPSRWKSCLRLLTIFDQLNVRYSIYNGAATSQLMAGSNEVCRETLWFSPGVIHTDECKSRCTIMHMFVCVSWSDRMPLAQVQ